MTTLILALGILAGALMSSLWHGRARIIGTFKASVGGLTEFPVVALIIDRLTYVLTQDEALALAEALRGVVSKQRATQVAKPAEIG